MKNMLNILMDLLSIQSYSGEERPVVDYVVPILEELGFNIHIDMENNIMATRGEAKTYAMLNAHMDSVKGYKTAYKHPKAYTFDEKVKQYKTSNKIYTKHCAKCSKVKTIYRPSLYCCPTDCPYLKKLKEIIETQEKETEKRDCYSCMYLDDCLNTNPRFWKTGILDLRNMSACPQWTSFDSFSEKDTQEEFELYFNKKTLQITSNKTRPMGGDDKCGIAIALQVAKDIGDKPLKLMFSAKEETGCQGVQFAIQNSPDFFSDVRYCITIDRRDSYHLCYTSAGVENCTLPFLAEMAKWGIINRIPVSIEKGSTADVVFLRNLITDTINISAGYFSSHTNNEYVDFKAVHRIRGWVRDMLTKSIYKVV